MDADIVAYSSSDTAGVIVGRHVSIATQDLQPPYLFSSGSSVAVSAVSYARRNKIVNGTSALQFARFANTSSGQPLRLDNIASASLDRSPRTRHAAATSATTLSGTDSPFFIFGARVSAAPSHADTSAWWFVGNSAKTPRRGVNAPFASATPPLRAMAICSPRRSASTTMAHSLSATSTVAVVEVRSFDDDVDDARDDDDDDARESLVGRLAAARIGRGRGGATRAHVDMNASECRARKNFMASDALFAWLNAASGVDRRATDASDLYDGEMMHRALARSSTREEEAAEDGEGDFIQKLSRQLRDAGARDDVRALRERDARGTMRVLREVYAESLRRRVAAFTLERERREETPPASRDDAEDKDAEGEGRDLIDTFDAAEEDAFDGVDDGWDDDDERDWVEEVDETDETADWRELASPAATARATERDVESPVRFLRASDILRELDVNDVDASESLRSPSEGSSHGTPAKKTLTRTPPPVPKTLRLWRSQSPTQRQKPASWDVVFDEPKTTGRVPTWFPGMHRAESTSTSPSTSRSRSPPTKPFAVSWMGAADDDEFNLQRAAQRRGRLTSTMPSSPERRRSDAGVVSCYRPPTSPSNKRVIRNALRVLVGPPDREPYVDAVRAIDACEFPSVVILLKGSANVAPYKLRGVYAVVENTTLKKIYGAGPSYLLSSEIVAALKYDTASMSFTTLPSPAITPTVAAISLTRAR